MHLQMWDCAGVGEGGQEREELIDSKQGFISSHMSRLQLEFVYCTLANLSTIEKSDILYFMITSFLV